MNKNALLTAAMVPILAGCLSSRMCSPPDSAVLTATPAEPVPAPRLETTGSEDIYTRLIQYRSGDKRTPLKQIEAALVNAGSEQKQAVEERLIEVLREPSATLPAKDFS